MDRNKSDPGWKTVASALVSMPRVMTELIIRNIPWQCGGSIIRKSYYKNSFKQLGNGGRFDEGVIIYGAHGIACGDNVFIGRNTIINGAGGLKLGNNILIGPGCYIWTINHDYSVVNIVSEPKYIAKPVVIGNEVWIGANVKIIPGVSIGARSVIGMGSVVTKDVPAGAVVAGNPAQVVKNVGTGLERE
ncbi:transferase hexapeptide repeat containing protein [Dehalogenimonas formicexedens]|uniref:Transferase hexapeptide repeat containing protein n=1 Tax=Dehalogenimonas formicexedens TaxID=1839801 RepID=A0A1P8F9K2_9CHLR|nr:acyltransferase [Dehalogenimonas formicexedens]APV45149.1 transferase hexapeptide repeat containing protein [Dehalogenimonas formicexedens]